MKLQLRLTIACVAFCLLIHTSPWAGNVVINGEYADDTTFTASMCQPCTLKTAALDGVGKTMTFQAGVQVVAIQDASLSCSTGTVIFNGKSDSIIVFTGTSGTRGWWNGIKFLNGAVNTTYNANGTYSSGSLIQYARVEYADTAIYMDSCSVGINQSDIIFNRKGIVADSVALLKIYNSRIAHNGMFENTAGAYGDIVSKRVKIEMNNCHVDSNSYYDQNNHAAGIVMLDNSRGIIRDSYFNFNRRDSAGGSGERAGAIYIKDGSSNDLKIINNEFNHGRSLWAAGIYLLACKNKVVIDSNTFFANYAELGGSGMTIARSNWSPSDSCQIRNNVFVDDSTIAIDLGNGADSTINLYNNTFVDCYDNTIGHAAGIHLDATATNTRIKNSIFKNFSDGYAIKANTSSMPDIDYCLFDDIADANFYHGSEFDTCTTCDSMIYELDPKLVNESTKDFRLNLGSPAINKGDPSFTVPKAGGSRIDIGAYEFPSNLHFYGDISMLNTPYNNSSSDSVEAEVAIENSCAPGTVILGGDYLGFIFWPNGASTQVNALDNFSQSPSNVDTLVFYTAIPDYVTAGCYGYVGYIYDSTRTQLRDIDSATFVINDAKFRINEEDSKPSVIPSSLCVIDNYPNPFNSQTSIEIGSPQVGEVNLTIYNLMGQKVATLINRKMEAGYHTVTWEALAVSSGVYFYKLTVGEISTTKRMMLLK